jgi:hypothetical protein
MGLRALSTVLLFGAFVLLLASGTQREKAVLAEGHEGAVQTLEASYYTHPSPTSLRELAQGYLDAGAPGLALSAIESALPVIRTDPRVQHTYARALLDSGRAGDALAAEEGVLRNCDLSSSAACDTWLIASATRRADILRELQKLGVDDALAHPESASVAYHAATRQARLVVAE